MSTAGLCAAGTGAMAGKASARPPLLDNFETVIDMVEDAGADPTGNEPITPLLREYADDDTVLVFPPGRYRMNEQFRFTGFNNFSIYGKWDVTIVPDNYYDFDDGGDWTENTPGDKLWRGPTGILCNNGNKGTVTFKDCELGFFPDNGLYAANGSGKVIVDGGVYKNSQTASVRIGGKDSVVKNARLVVDENSGRGNQHALRAENSNYIRVKNCNIEASDANGAAIKSMNVGHLRFEGTTVKTGGSEVAHGLLIQQKTKSARIVGSTFVHETPGGFSLWMESGEEPVYVENCEFKGNGGHDGARAAIRCDRDDCQLRNVTAAQMGASRRRALVNTGTDVLVYEGEYRSPEYPIIDHGDSIWVESIYARSDGDFAGLRLSTSSSNAYVKKSHIVNGIRDDSGDLSGWGNDFSA